MRRAFVITKPGSVSPKLLEDIATLGFPPPETRETDTRKERPEDLVVSGRISHGAYLSILHGRSSDFDIPSPGGVGCFMSHLSLCQTMAELPLGTLCLVMEADCRMDIPLMKAALASIEAGKCLNTLAPHVVLFGGRPIRAGTKKSSEIEIVSGAQPIPGTDTELRPTLPGSVIVLAHCCLYTVAGAKFVSQALEDKPIDVQWDSALSVVNLLPTHSEHRLLWWCPKGAKQSPHLSSIQDICVTCAMRGAPPFILFFGLLLIAFLVGAKIGSG